MTVGQWIKEEREKSGLSIRKLSEKSGISLSYLSQIERDLKNPSIDVIVKLGNALNTPIENVLLHRKDIRKMLHHFLSDCEIKTILEICKIRDVDLITYFTECVLIQTSKDAKEYEIFERNPWLKCGEIRF